MRRTSHIPVLALAAALLWQVSCRDAPRDNPFDPEAGILLVSVLSPQDSSVFLVGEKVEFRALARTGYDDLPAGSGWLWSSSISGQLSNEAEFSTDSLPSGTHRITVLVEDSLWGQGSAHVAVTVKELTELMVRITSPAADTVFLAGGLFSPAAREYIPDGISVSGRAWHFGDGSGIADITAAAPGTVVWDIPGTFEMTYQVVDTYGRSAADTLVVTVLATSEPPLVKIISPAADTT
ncbi:MAG: hypothetical protein JXQ83_12390, partial [Candidatus Glassbacteria bacterium]|nr:hypothetical protein [Candidatus Glassbacteria bacterium]